MNKLLVQMDTDAVASVFDAVVAYDGGADQLIQLAGVTPANCAAAVEGAIFTRPPQQKKNTAIFVGGGDLAAGEALFAAVQKRFFGNFRVSVLLDSNGCNTTAAAAVAQLTNRYDVADKTAVVLAGTGPVGQRAAILLANEGAEIRLTSRRMDRARETCARLRQQYGASLTPMVANNDNSIGAALHGAHIVLGAGKSGVQLLTEAQWQSQASVEVLVDVSTAPPLGFEGIDLMDKGIEREGKLVFGGIGIGALKLKVHRACIERLFEQNDKVFDAEAVYEIARELA